MSKTVDRLKVIKYEMFFKKILKSKRISQAKEYAANALGVDIEDYIEGKDDDADIKDVFESLFKE